MKQKYMIVGAVAVLMLMAGCNKGGFMGPDRSMYDFVQTMVLEVSSSEVLLDAETPDEIALSFSWTPAREMPDDYIVTYVTMLDIEGNDFSNCIREVEDDGTFIKEYTHQQLQDYLVNKWGKNYSRAVNMEFKVIAKWDGGEKYIMPEVCETGVSVRPFRPLVFEADRVFISGDAVTGTSKQAIGRTPENEFVYAEEVWLKPGELTIPIEYGGVTTYICPAEGSVDIPDNDQVDERPSGSEYPAAVREEPDEGEMLPAWNIPSEGYWRVIVDMENKCVRFFSPKNRLEPLTVEFNYSTSSDWLLGKTIGEGTYYFNTMTGWDSWKGKGLEFSVSKQDPQILIWQGSAMTVSDKFCIKTGQKLADFEVLREGTTGDNPTVDNTTNFVSRILAFVPEGNEDAPMTMNEWLPMMQAVSNKKWTFEGQIKISKITIDLRNNRIRFD